MDEESRFPHRGCDRCETLPAPPPRGGIIYLCAPMTHTEVILEQVAQDLGVKMDRSVPEVKSLELDATRLERFCILCQERLTPLELDDTKALLLPWGRMPAVRDLIQMGPLRSLVARVLGRWLEDILSTGRMVSHFQPIVEAANPRRVFAYECLLRGFDEKGRLISPGDMLAQARQADLLFHLDRAARITAIQSAQGAAVDTVLFINFIPSAIYDPAYCLETTMAAADQAGLTPERVVFEVVESEKVADLNHLDRILDFYRERGYRVALDDVGAGYNSLQTMAKIKPEFVKIDQAFIRGVHADAYKGRIVASLLGLCAELGIVSLAEGVETPEEYWWLREHGAELMQGFLFAHPAATPPPVEFDPEA